MNEIITGVSFQSETGVQHRFEQTGDETFTIFERPCIVDPEMEVGTFEIVGENTVLRDDEGNIFETLSTTDHFEILDFLRAI